MTESQPQPDPQELLEAIEQVYDRVGRTEDLLPGEFRWTTTWRQSDLQMLPLAARGLYSEMLTQAWAGRARLKMTGEDEIMRLVRAIPEEWATAWPRVRGYWIQAKDPRNGADVLVNLKQLTVYLKCLQSRVLTLVRNRRAWKASVEARKGKGRATAAEPLAARAPRQTAPSPPAQVPPPPSTAAPKAVREVPPCPECSGELKRKQRAASQGGTRFPPHWWCATQGISINLNDPRIYSKLTEAARASVDHELQEYERATAATTGPEPAPAKRPGKPVTPAPPAGPSALERSRPSF